MQSSSTSTDTEIRMWRSTDPYIEDPEIVVRCDCGKEADIETTWVRENAGRRYYKCPIYDQPNSCMFFKWMDRDYSQWTKNLLLEFRRCNTQLLNDVLDSRKANRVQKEVAEAHIAILSESEIKKAKQVKWLVFLIIVMSVVQAITCYFLLK